MWKWPSSKLWNWSINPFPHIRFLTTLQQTAFWKQWQKKKLHKTCNFSFCHNVFHFLSYVIHSIMEIFYFLSKYVQSRLLQNCSMRERLTHNCPLCTYQSFMNLRQIIAYSKLIYKGTVWQIGTPIDYNCFQLKIIWVDLQFFATCTYFVQMSEVELESKILKKRH